LSIIKKLGAATAAVAVGGTLALAPALSASATHPQVTITAACTTGESTATVTTTITGDPAYADAVYTIKTVNRQALKATFEGKTVAGSQAIVGVEGGVKAGNYAVNVNGRFSTHTSDTTQQSSITVPNCVPPVVERSFEFGTYPATCGVAGGLAPDFTLGTPAQNPNGWELDGGRIYLDKPYTGPGTYNYTVQKVGPGFDPKYPSGTKIVGKTSGTLVVEAAIPFQSADPAAPCFDRPGVPDPKVVVTHTDWTDGEYTCGDTTVEQTRAETVTVTPYVWDEATKSYVLDAGNVKATSSSQTELRPLTAEEIEQANIDCAGPQPEAKVTESEWKDEEWECDDTTTLQTRTVTRTPYVRDGAVWVLDHANSTTDVERQERVLDADEIIDCPVVEKVVKATPVAVLATTGTAGGFGIGVLAGAFLLGGGFIVGAAAFRRKRLAELNQQ
jgi:hypothetical protein